MQLNTQNMIYLICWAKRAKTKGVSSKLETLPNLYACSVVQTTF